MIIVDDPLPLAPLTERLVTILCGPAGVGKNTQLNIIRKAMPHLHLAVSMTTRERAPKEVHGEDRYFVTVPEFKMNIARKKFLEYEEIHGNFYGTLHEEFTGDRPIICEIDISGAAKLKMLLHKVLIIYLKPPSMEELRDRLEKRDRESKEKIARRLIHAAKEEYLVASGQAKVDHTIVNEDKLATARKIMEWMLTREPALAGMQNNQYA